MLTRLRQGVSALTANRSPVPFPSSHRGRVTPGIIAHWDQLSPYDQRHLVAVATDLARGGLPDTVVLAGLLHDIGKGGDVWLTARVAVVLMRRLAPGATSRLRAIKTPPWGARGIHVLLNHAERGARLLDASGMRPQVSWLVRHHESQVSHPYLSALRAADHRH